jgi:hypothetical protein
LLIEFTGFIISTTIAHKMDAKVAKEKMGYPVNGVNGVNEHEAEIIHKTWSTDEMAIVRNTCTFSKMISLLCRHVVRKKDQRIHQRRR